MLLVLSSLFSVAAKAEVSWVGNARINNVRRGNFSSGTIEGRTLEINICDYGTNQISFEVYKPGVTDIDGASVWQQINAQAKLVKDSNGETISSSAPTVKSRVGNNALYNLYFQGMFPSAVTGLDPEAVNTHLLIALDGNIALSIPVHFSCIN
jgi:hypothetical protein